ncbi:Rrf2 family transcriptional regulator [Thermocatellispora tengchongensis]|uniref:Rrf2 family transcriptional regulator n=1 Tax=Thermocatellispora tengchongensis TaxID=1073253 RepID=UPI003635A9E8
MARSTNTRFAVAVHVLTYLAGVAGERPVSSDELSASTNVNPVHVRRVLGPLRAAGLLRSRPGVHGGWELAVPAGDITLAEVWRLLQGRTRCSGCMVPTRRARSAAACRSRWPSSTAPSRTPSRTSSAGSPCTTSWRER